MAFTQQGPPLGRSVFVRWHEEQPCSLFLETRNIATTTAAASLCVRSKCATAGAGASGRHRLSSVRGCGRLSNGLFLHWPALLFLESRFSRVGDAPATDWSCGARMAAPANGEETMEHPCSGQKSDDPGQRQTPRSRAQTLQHTEYLRQPT